MSQGINAVPHAGTDSSDGYDEDVQHRFGIKCPTCGHWCAVLTEHYPVNIVREWTQWNFGGDCYEPYSMLMTTCRRCKNPFTYTLYYPQ